MSFCLPRFWRRIQPSDLQEYFGARAIHFSEPIDWTAKPADLLSSAKAAIEALPERERERVFEDFERIDQVSDEIGQRALRSLIEQDVALLHRFHSCKRRTRRPVIEAAIYCDPVSGMLDIVSKGGRPLREEIAQSFAARLLDSENALSPVRPRDFDLDRLKRPMPFPTDPSDGIKNVEVTLLRLRNAAGHFGRVTIEVDGEHTDIYRTSAGWFGDFDPLRRPEWRVMQARLRIAFHPEGRGKRGKSITVELRAPNSSNLRDQTRRHQIVSEKYLVRWGLIEETMAAVA